MIENPTQLNYLIHHMIPLFILLIACGVFWVLATDLLKLLGWVMWKMRRT